MRGAGIEGQQRQDAFLFETCLEGEQVGLLLQVGDALERHLAELLAPALPELLHFGRIDGGGFDGGHGVR
jgi:hypothetical protein